MFKPMTRRGWLGITACLIGLALLSSPMMGSARDEKKEQKAANDHTERVRLAKQLLMKGDTYPKGCSEFVSKVLGIPWESANQLMGDRPMNVGVDGKYTGLKPGDIVGWKNAEGHGHVAVYIGEEGKKSLFIDVRKNDERPRSLHSYGPKQLCKSSRF